MATQPVNHLNNDRGICRSPVKVLVVDVGGTNVKILATGRRGPRKVPSGRTMTAQEMVEAVKQLAAGWSYEAISLGYPGPLRDGQPVAEPKNLGAGWVGFNFEKAFKCPVKVINDAAMQALGCYHGGKMLFLGLGTGLGTALIVDGIVEPMELSHLPYRKGVYEDYVGQKSLDKHGKRKWRRYVKDVVERLVAALEPDDVVIGGGNVKYLKNLPAGARAGSNADAFPGGFRLWESDAPRPAVRVKRGKSS